MIPRTPSGTSGTTRVERGSESLDDQLEYHDIEHKGENKLGWHNKSKEHPRNWSTIQKAWVTLVICWLECYMTAISTSGAATATGAMSELQISKLMGSFAFITVYLIGQLIGGIFCAPISELSGRRTIYSIGTSIFAVGSVIVAAVPSLAGVFVGRFIQGVAAAIPATVAFGNFNDMFDAHSRVWVVYGYTFAGMSGLALGPIYASYVTHALGWRWVYWISTIMAGASLPACLVMKESDANQVLENKVDNIREKTGKDHLEHEGADEDGGFSVKGFFTDNLYRPIKMLVTEPLVFFCAALCGIAFGLVYGLTEALTIVYTATPFSFSEQASSLSFLAIFIGLALDLFPRIYDDYVLKRTRREKKRIVPETKIRSFAVACPSLAIGLWIFAWTIPSRVTTVPWPVSMIGLVCIGFSLNDFSYVLFGYISDSYGEYAASAASAISITRTIAGAVFPLFTTQMYNGLGNNVATTILAAVATAFCFTPWLFLIYGHKLRHSSNMAQDDEKCLREENTHLDERGDQADRGHMSDDQNEEPKDRDNGRRGSEGRPMTLRQRSRNGNGPSEDSEARDEEFLTKEIKH